MSDAGLCKPVPDHLYERLFQPWKLAQSEWPLCREDWARVDAITRLPWQGVLLDFGCGDGTLAAMVMSRNPLVKTIWGVERDKRQWKKVYGRWEDWRIYVTDDIYGHGPVYDGALLCEVLEHLSADEGQAVLIQIKQVLRPGAMLCVTVPHEAGSRAAYPGHVRTFSLERLQLACESAGFAVVETDTIGGQVIPIWIRAMCRA